MKQFNIEDLVLANITVSEASIDNPEDKSLNEQEQSILEFGLSFDTLFNLDIEGVLIKLYVEIRCLNDKEEFVNIKANFTTQFAFKVNGLAEYIQKEKDVISALEPQLYISILNIVYSTSRGIIYTRSLGTVLGTVILPVISSQELLEYSQQNRNQKKEG